MGKNRLEFRTTVRFPEKDWKRMDDLVDKGEFCCITDVIRAAVKDLIRKYKK